VQDRSAVLYLDNAIRKVPLIGRAISGAMRMSSLAQILILNGAFWIR